MIEPKDMRFYCRPLEAEPVGPKARHRYHGRPRKSFSLTEAAAYTKWPELSLVALFNATYPQDGGDDDGRLTELAEAMWHPPVRDALLYFYGHCGKLSAETFMLCLLIGWDMDDPESKGDTIHEALAIKACRARTWFTNARAAGRKEGGDDE